MNGSSLFRTLASVIAVAGATSPALAQSADNEPFQAFFKGTVCSDLTLVLPYIARCGQTEAADPLITDPNIRFANISNASESSLNPSQIAATAASSARTAEALAEQTERRLEGLRDKEDGKPTTETGTIAGFGPWSLFASVEGEWFDQSRRPFQLERAFDGDRFRGLIGVDYRVSASTVVGLTVSYERSKLTFDAEPSGALNAVQSAFVAAPNGGGRKARTWTVGAFLTTSLDDRAWIDLAGGYGWSDNRFRRFATFQADLNATGRFDVRAFGKADGKQVFASAGIGTELADGATSFSPYARVRYVRATVNSYDEFETATPKSFLTFAVPKQSSSSFVSVLGVRASHAISTSWGVLVPQVRLEYEHEFRDGARTVDLRLTEQPTSNQLTLPIISSRRDPNYLNAAAGLVFVLPHGMSAFVEYEGLLGYSNFSRHRASAGVRFSL